MRKSTRSKSADKPRTDFPLFRHRNGQWAKKICGRLVYFGTDASAALSKYLDEKDELYAGRVPRARGQSVTLAELVNRFLDHKRNRMAAGELTGRTWQDYYRMVERLIDFFGRSRPVLSFVPEDFDRFRAKLSETRGPVAISKSIITTRVIFKWAFDNDLIVRPVRFGTLFTKPPKKVLRKAKRESGSRVFDADDLRKLIDAAKPTMRAMVLVGINCGFGQSDIANLPIDAIDLDAGWIDFPRPKTETLRRCPLWPETVEALKAALARRHEPKHEVDARLAFLTSRGQRWIRQGQHKETEALYWGDFIASEFAKVAKRLGVKRRGSFYCLRHTFRTVADVSKDQPAIDCIMGHTRGDMAEEYRERISDDRLRAVADTVRAWLFAPQTTRKPAAQAEAGEPTILAFRPAAG